MMKLFLVVILLAATHAFISPVRVSRMVKSIVGRGATLESVKYRLRMVESGVEDDTEAKSASTESAAEEVPTYLPSDCGVDYIPLATMLATGDYEGADQFTRDTLIKIAGPAAKKREYVYFTEANILPSTDLCTMERLWLQFSDGAFGYSVQKRVWDIEKGDFDKFIRRIGWTTVENDSERKLRWYGKSEFIYTLKAPKGHLPLTSALRGTQLIKKLMEHPVWSEYDWKNYKNLKWEP